MNRLMTMICCACLMGASAAAQTGSTEKMDKDKMAKHTMANPMMVTGCVAAGSESGHYMLTNGMMAGDTTGKSYELMGGDLKAHVGHKVEITGMMAHDKMMGKDKMAKDHMDHGTMDKDKMPKDHMTMSDMHGALNVKSVKMISATCP